MASSFGLCIAKRTNKPGTYGLAGSRRKRLGKIGENSAQRDFGVHRLEGLE